MTIHKAKGLEFDSVIVPGLEFTPRGEEAKLLLWEEDVTQPGRSLLTAGLSEAGTEHNRRYDYLKKIRADKDRFEIGRLLYVGCTRARHGLHLIGTVKTSEDGIYPPPTRSFLDQIWHVTRADFEQTSHQQRMILDSPIESASAQAIGRLPTNWEVPVPSVDLISVAENPFRKPLDDTNIEFSWVGETSRYIGILLHEFLYRLDSEAAFELRVEQMQRYRRQWRNALIGYGVSNSELKSALVRLECMVRNISEDPRAKWLFDPNHRDIHWEYAISGNPDGALRSMRIDRAFIDRQGVRWIVDFKSSAHEGGDLESFLDREVERYKGQLESYARMFSALENRPLRLGLYFPLLKGWREWLYVAR